jgi:hypothetical protein
MIRHALRQFLCRSHYCNGITSDGSHVVNAGTPQRQPRMLIQEKSVLPIRWFQPPLSASNIKTWKQCGDIPTSLESSVTLLIATVAIWTP